jgi:hypothetical protein
MAAVAEDLVGVDFPGLKILVLSFSKRLLSLGGRLRPLFAHRHRYKQHLVVMLTLVLLEQVALSVYHLMPLLANCVL